MIFRGALGYDPRAGLQMKWVAKVPVGLEALKQSYFPSACVDLIFADHMEWAAQTCIKIFFVCSVVFSPKCVAGCVWKRPGWPQHAMLECYVLDFWLHKNVGPSGDAFPSRAQLMLVPNIAGLCLFWRNPSRLMNSSKRTNVVFWLECTICLKNKQRNAAHFGSFLDEKHLVT